MTRSPPTEPTREGHSAWLGPMASVWSPSHGVPSRRGEDSDEGLLDVWIPSERQGAMSGSSRGWYQDPANPSEARYWNGREWTDMRRHARQGDRSSPPSPPPPWATSDSGAPISPSTTGYRWFGAGLVLLVLMVAAGLSLDDPPTPGGGSSTSGGGVSGGYSGSYHNDINGNRVPDDCAEWAASASNPFTTSDRVEVGTALCEGYG